MAAFVIKEKATKDRWEKRWQIVDPDSGEVLDDAQGYGYKSIESARKAGWYKFKGGKGKTETEKAEALTFWKRNKTFARQVDELGETWFKEIARGEINYEAEVQELASRLDVAGYQEKYLKYLP